MQFPFNLVSSAISLYDGNSHVFETASSYVGNLDTSPLSCTSFYNIILKRVFIFDRIFDSIKLIIILTIMTHNGCH